MKRGFGNADWNFSAVVRIFMGYLVINFLAEPLIKTAAAFLHKICRNRTAQGRIMLPEAGAVSCQF